jgi:hypothetical protein
MDPLYRSNVDNAKCIQAMIMSDYVSDDYSIDVKGQNPMKILWNQEKVSVHRMITVTLKWTQLTTVFNRRTRQSKVR